MSLCDAAMAGNVEEVIQRTFKTKTKFQGGDQPFESVGADQT